MNLSKDKIDVLRDMAQAAFKQQKQCYEDQKHIDENSPDFFLNCGVWNGLEVILNKIEDYIYSTPADQWVSLSYEIFYSGGNYENR